MSAIAEILARQGWTLAAGCQPDNIGSCRSCGAQILWCITASGRKAPYNRDGASHFATCPAAGQWRKPR